MHKRISEGWQVSGGLLVPKELVEKSKSDKEQLKKDFKKRFDDLLSENSHRTDPYFVLYKAKFDGLKPNISRQVFTIYEDKPPFIARSLVFWVDNKNSVCILLWECGIHKTKFNTEGVKKLEGVFRPSVAG